MGRDNTHGKLESIRNYLTARRAGSATFIAGHEGNSVKRNHGSAAGAERRRSGAARKMDAFPIEPGV
jgi:hypothetical protein